MSGLPTIRTKIRALVEDFLTVKAEYFSYTTSAVFTLCGNNIIDVDEVLINGAELQSGEDFEYDEDTNKVTIIADLSSGDLITIIYKTYKYTDSELDQYVNAGLVYISLYNSPQEADFELEGETIVPTPENKEEDLMALVASVLIKPDYSSYRLPTISVTYPKQMSKEERIRKVVSEFYRSLGINDTLSIDYR